VLVASAAAFVAIALSTLLSSSVRNLGRAGAQPGTAPPAATVAE
jgi:hypothetical protein